MYDHVGTGCDGGPSDGDGRLSGIPTRWSMIQGPRREALDYLFRVYWSPLRRYLAGCIRTGKFDPLRADDSEDLLADFFLYLGKSDWLEKPDPAKGRFHVYLKRRIAWFLMDCRKSRRTPADSIEGSQERPPIELGTGDGLDARFEKEWAAATVRECLARLRAHNPAQAAVLQADLEEDGLRDADLARRLGRSVESVRKLRQRGEAEFRRLYSVLEGRFDRGS